MSPSPEERLAAARRSGDRKEEAHALESLGNKCFDGNQTLRYYQEAQAIYQSLGDNQGVARIYVSLGGTYDTYFDDLQMALKCYKMVLKTDPTYPPYLVESEIERVKQRIREQY